ncbi:hypothetical protein ABZY44_30315 [Streptomyces sp. NPDC006544]|uniref:hypothetical protein n=1 Tax=Streptomyces sp. NPDC006544 TaxID=3154583 RepID=UPI0033B03140
MNDLRLQDRRCSALPLLEAGDAPVIVNVSSGPGSPAACADPGRNEFRVALLDYNSSTRGSSSREVGQ